MLELSVAAFVSIKRRGSSFPLNFSHRVKDPARVKTSRFSIGNWKRNHIVSRILRDLDSIMNSSRRRFVLHSITFSFFRVSSPFRSKTFRGKIPFMM